MRLTVIGGYGRMGKRIIELALKEGITVSCAVEMQGSPVLGKKISDVFVVGENEKHGVFSENLISETDVVIDFSSPESTMKHLRMASKNEISYVIGTTGFSKEQEIEIEKLSKTASIVKSANMSLGVNVLFQITKQVSSMLGPQGYDIEIVELHHNKKKDSPSGTAKKLLDCIVEGAGKKHEDAVYGREGILGERKKEEIGVMAVRAGDIIGEHTVYLAGNDERIELTHRAHSRDTFARGAITAAKFVVGKPHGLYDMKDVLGLK